MQKWLGGTINCSRGVKLNYRHNLHNLLYEIVPERLEKANSCPSKFPREGRFIG